MPSQPLHLSIHDAWQTIAKAPPDRPVIFTVVGETLLNELDRRCDRMSTAARAEECRQSLRFAAQRLFRALRAHVELDVESVAREQRGAARFLEAAYEVAHEDHDWPRRQERVAGVPLNKDDGGEG